MDNKIRSALSKLKDMNYIDNFSMRGKTVYISFPEKQSPVFLIPTIDEEQVIEFLTTANHTTIEILKCITDFISCTNTFPTQKQIAKAIYKDNTTVCKCFTDLKRLNIVYKGEDGKLHLSELSTSINGIIGVSKQ